MAGPDDHLARILDTVSSSLNVEAARRIVDLKPDPLAQQRIDYLAERCNEGELSPDEQSEYETYVAAANVIAILKLKARVMLSGQSA